MTEQIIDRENEPCNEMTALPEEEQANIDAADGRARPEIEKLRLFLMLCACIQLLGFPTKLGDFVQSLCGFAPIAFFILSGHLVLGQEEGRSERIVRAIKRTALAFALLFAFYTVINLILYHAMGVDILPSLKSKRLWFNFIVLNVWPFGVCDAIWYVQALLYAYIIAYFLDKLKLLKYDWIFFIVLFLFAVVTGELNGIFHFSFFGYTAFPANFLNRALPYLLLGGFFFRKMPRLGEVPIRFYLLGIIAGGVLVFLEPMLLERWGVGGYYGHLIGMAVIAASVCQLVFQNVFLKGAYNIPLTNRFPLSRGNINVIYYLCQPMGMVLGFWAISYGVSFFDRISGYLGLVTFLICCLISVLTAVFFGIIRGKLQRRREQLPPGEGSA